MGHRSPSMDRWGRVKQPLRAMQPRAVADAIRSRAAAAGIDRASGHSLRVGAAVSMAQRGASLVAMQQAGGWCQRRLKKLQTWRVKMLHPAEVTSL